MQKFDVKSRTQKGVIYRVLYFKDDGHFECNCNAGQREVACNHLDLIRKFLNREPILPSDYDRFEEIK